MPALTWQWPAVHLPLLSIFPRVGNGRSLGSLANAMFTTILFPEKSWHGTQSDLWEGCDSIEHTRSPESRITRTRRPTQPTTRTLDRNRISASSSLHALRPLSAAEKEREIVFAVGFLDLMKRVVMLSRLCVCVFNGTAAFPLIVLCPMPILGEWMVETISVGK